MAESMRRGEPFTRPGEASRFDDEPELEVVAPEPEASPGRLKRVFGGSGLWAGLTLLIGIAGTGFAGGRIIEHSRRVQDLVYPQNYDLLDRYFAGFLIMGGLLVGIAVAGVYARKVWGAIALTGMLTMIALSFVFIESMSQQLKSFQAVATQQCTPVALRSGAVANALADPGQQATVCTAAPGAKAPAAGKPAPAAKH